MELREALVEAIAHLSQHLFNGQLESLRFPVAAAEGAKPAAVYANVGVVDVLVHHVGGEGAVAAGAYRVSQSAHGVYVRAGEQPFAVFDGQAFLVLHFGKDRGQTEIFIPVRIQHGSSLSLGLGF
jgi:hypothetical protein